MHNDQSSSFDPYGSEDMSHWNGASELNNEVTLFISGCKVLEICSSHVAMDSNF